MRELLLDGFVEYISPELIGVYVLCLEGDIIYIGQSTNVTARLREHRRKGKVFDCVYVRYCAEAELDRIEVSMIRKHKPKNNITNNNELPNIKIDLAKLGLVRRSP